MMRALFRWVSRGLLAATFAATVAFAEARVDREEAELNLQRALEAIALAQPAAAKSLLRDTLARYPNFRLARMVYADLIASQAQLPPLLSAAAAQDKLRIAGLSAEAKARLRERSARLAKLPADIIRLSPKSRHLVLFDAEYSRLYVFENDHTRPRLVADYYAAAGKGGMDKRSEGDNRTPSGVYQIVSTLGDAQLPELYGEGAYVLDYPNAWDKTQRRSGSGIWLHGVPRITYSRPPTTSRGCVVSSNLVVQKLRPYIIPNKTSVVLATQTDWLDEAQWQSRQTQLMAAIAQWQSDWQSLDVERYLSHYSAAYQDLKLNYQQMLRQTRRNATRKTFVKVAVKNIDLLRYSKNPERYVAHFDQDYKSNNYNIAYRKQQIWQREGSAWKIIFEGRV